MFPGNPVRKSASKPGLETGTTHHPKNRPETLMRRRKSKDQQMYLLVY